MMAVEPNNTDLPDPNPGPTDDGYIAVAEKSVPQDPFCCSGPNKDDLGEVLVKALSYSYQLLFGCRASHVGRLA